MDGTFEVIRRIAAELSGQPEAAITAETRIYDDLTLDSLDEVEIAMDVEEAFGLDLPHDVFEGCETVADLVRAVDGVRANVG